MRALVFIVGQLRQLLHDLLSLVSTLDNLFKNLRHHEDVIDLLAEKILHRALFYLDFKLIFANI